VSAARSASDGRAQTPLTDALIDAVAAAGHERNPTSTAPARGVGRFQVTQRDGMRCSPAVAYLHPAMERPNLDVITHAMSQRLLFDGDRVVGVEISRLGEVQEIRAEREVIVSAGAYQSPVLLLLSGIGPADELALMGIESRVDLPVGENLQDHFMANLNYTTADGSFGALDAREHCAVHGGTSRSAELNIAEGAVFMRTTRPHRARHAVHSRPGCSMTKDHAPAQHGYAFGPVVIKPSSRGKVSLRTPMADSKPLVLCNFLTTEEDRQCMLSGMRKALEVAEQEPLREIMRTPYTAPAGDSDDEIMDFVRRAAHTVYHPTSTCAIGSVVDPELRVYGRGPAGRRRLGDAERDPRQHQRPHDHDR
jgi:choline dehydrogenase-like flavoprotein